MNAFGYSGESRNFTPSSQCQWEKSINQTDSVHLHQSFTMSHINERQLGDVINSPLSIRCTSPRHLDSVNTNSSNGITGRQRSKTKSAATQQQESIESAPSISLRSKSRTPEKARISRSDLMENVTSSAVGIRSPYRRSSHRKDTVEDREVTCSPFNTGFNNQGKEKSAFFIFIPGINGKALCLSNLGEQRKTVRSNSSKTSKQCKTNTSSESSREYRKCRTKELDSNCWTGAKDSCGQRSVISDTSIGSMTTHESRRSQSRSIQSSRTSKSPSIKCYTYDLQGPPSPLDHSEQGSFHSVRSPQEPGLSGKLSLRRHRLDTSEKIASLKTTLMSELSNTSKYISQKESLIKEVNIYSRDNTLDTLRKESQPRPYRQHSFNSDNGLYTRGSSSPRSHSRKTTDRSTFATLNTPPSPSTRSLPNFRECSDHSERSCASAGSAREPLRYNSPKDDKFTYMMAQLRLDREKADKERRAVLKLKQNLHREDSYRKVQKYLTKFNKGSISVTVEHNTPKLSPQGLLLGVD